MLWQDIEEDSHLGLILSLIQATLMLAIHTASKIVNWLGAFYICRRRETIQILRVDSYLVTCLDFFPLILCLDVHPYICIETLSCRNVEGEIDDALTGISTYVYIKGVNGHHRHSHRQQSLYPYHMCT